MPVFGVDIESLLLYEPENLEELVNGLNEVLTLIPKGVGPNVIVWDSLAATELEGQLEKGVGKSAFVGKRARIMSETLPLLGRLARDHRCAIVVINQLRDKIGVVFGDSTTTPGGHALKFHSSWRFRLWRGAQTRANGPPAGMYTTIKAVKNKVGLPFRKAKFKLDFDTGWDTDWALLNLGKDQKILPNKALATEKNLNQVREALGFGGIVTPAKGGKKPRKKFVEPDPGGPESRIDDSVLLDDGWPDDSPDGDDDGEE
jgi:recombination protein RecA